ncbi:unnamed protein product [Amoebophrya sp. A120]|nr:unnamed protein product [Amoebophrya sp. A120]|eukprot:GSA120T00005619001.1
MFPLVVVRPSWLVIFLRCRTSSVADFSPAVNNPNISLRFIQSCQQDARGSCKRSNNYITIRIGWRTNGHASEKRLRGINMPKTKSETNSASLGTTEKTDSAAGLGFFVTWSKTVVAHNYVHSCSLPRLFCRRNLRGIKMNCMIDSVVEILTSLSNQYFYRKVRKMGDANQMGMFAN